MSRKYKFYNSIKPHFVSFATVKWTDVFIRRIYFEVIVQSLSYCIKHKGLIVNAWVIMTNHIHLIIRSDTNQLENIMRDMKKFTSKELLATIKDHPQESRKDELLQLFRQAGIENSNNKEYQLWQQHNHPIALSTREMREQRLHYLHMNPVKAGFVQKPQHWLYSSVGAYAGQQEMLERLEFIT